MAASAEHRFDAIQAMLTRGHRSIRLERHTLLIWGLAGALLCLVADLLITHDRFPERWQRAVAVIALLGGVLFSAGWLDYRLTRQLRRARDETLSFVQGQIYKVWWLLLGMGVLLNFAMVFFGGGYMSYSIWMTLVGLGLFVHALFSEQSLEWGGVSLIVVAAAVLVLKLPYDAIRWVAVFTFGLGVPAFGWLFDAGVSRSFSYRLGQSLLLLGAIAALAAGAFRVATTTAPVVAPAVSLEQYLQDGLPAAGERGVILPAGTTIPLRVTLNGDAIEPVHGLEVPLTLTRALEVVLKNGKPDGRYRLAGEADWRSRRYDLRIREVRMDASLDPEQGPVATLRAKLFARK